MAFMQCCPAWSRSRHRELRRTFRERAAAIATSGMVSGSQCGEVAEQCGRQPLQDVTENASPGGCFQVCVGALCGCATVTGVSPSPGRGGGASDGKESTMRFWTTIGLILVLSAVGLTYEIAAGRVLAPFFGTSLVTWTAVIATVLAGFSVGSALGGLLAERDRRGAFAGVRAALVGTAALAALSPTILGFLYASGARGTGGMLLSVVVAFFPASVLVSTPSPFLAKLAVEARPGREGSSLGFGLAAGSVGGIFGAILAAFVALPLVGSAATFAGCGAAALLCALLVRDRATGDDGEVEQADGRSTEPGSVAMFAAAALLVAASMAGGPA